jgi:hypothetical protein
MRDFLPGLRVQGFSDANLSAVGDVRINTDQFVVNYSITRSGKLSFSMPDRRGVVRAGGSCY